jgi:hypothetical protein
MAIIPPPLDHSEVEPPEPFVARHPVMASLACAATNLVSLFIVGVFTELVALRSARHIFHIWAESLVLAWSAVGFIGLIAITPRLWRQTGISAAIVLSSLWMMLGHPLHRPLSEALWDRFIGPLLIVGAGVLLLRILGLRWSVAKQRIDRWQFSIRTIWALTVLVAVYVAIAFNAPEEGPLRSILRGTTPAERMLATAAFQLTTLLFVIAARNPYWAIATIITAAVSSAALRFYPPLAPFEFVIFFTAGPGLVALPWTLAGYSTWWGKPLFER